MVSLALDPPPSARNGRTPRNRGPRRVALVLAAVVIGGAGFLAGRWTAPRGGDAENAGAAPAPDAASDGVAAATADPATPGAPAAGALPPSAPGDPAVAVPAPLAADPAAPPPTRLVATLSGALEASIAAALPPGERALAEQLTQVVNRLLVWEFRVAREGRKGDRLEVLFSPAGPPLHGMPASSEPVVEALRFHSQKLGRTIAAYRHQPDGSKWPRYYRDDGSELEERLLTPVIADYDQVTSLLRDGRGHKGVDFRTPVGTPVFAAFDGVVVRRNWNFGVNGNCLEIRDPRTGRSAIYLHLDVLPKEMKAGRRVKKGEQVAFSGNSGRSFAPHLHYQLEDSSGRVLDPFEVHGSTRLALEPAQRAAFDARRNALAAALAEPPARPAPAPVAAPVPSAAPVPAVLR